MHENENFYESSLKAVVERSNDPMIIHREGRILYANKGVTDWVGPELASELPGMSTAQFILPDDQSNAKERLAALKNIGDTASGQLKAPHKDGSIREVETQSILIWFDGGESVLTILKPITDEAETREIRQRAEVADIITDALISVEPNGRITSWNQAAENMYGWEKSQALGGTSKLILGVSFQSISNYPLAESVKEYHRTKTGRMIPVKVRAYANPEGGFVLVVTDISELERESSEHAALSDKHAAVVSSLSEGILVADANGVVESCNEAAKRILNRPENYIIGRNVVDFDHAVSTPEGGLIPETERPLYKLLHDGEEVTDLIVSADDGEGVRWWSITTRALRHTPTSSPYAVVCSLSDITSEWRALEHLQHSAAHDTLTGLPNRSATTREIQLRRQNGEDMAVFFIDLDSFKVINDSLGHEAGDLVLSSVAERMRRSLTDNTFLGRLGGDEFVGITNGEDPAQAERVIRNIIKALEEPIMINEQHLVVTASVGVAFGRTSENKGDLLRDADIAMYAAKNSGKNQVMRFDSYMREDASQGLLIREELREALKNGDVTPYYQPISSAANGEIVGFEALARWVHPDGVVSNPSEFISVAESSGLILELGRTILKQSCAALSQERKRSGKDLHVAVNLSAQQFVDERIITLVKDTLQEYDLPAHALWLEITESMLMEQNRVTQETLLALRALGVQLSIDDFGTGYSSLAYLQNFPVTTLKIDKSFIDGVLTREKDAAIVKTILALARNLGLTAVAEGVEELKQFELLKAEGCDFIQGYLVGRPNPSMLSN